MSLADYLRDERSYSTSIHAKLIVAIALICGLILFNNNIKQTNVETYDFNSISIKTQQPIMVAKSE